MSDNKSNKTGIIYRITSPSGKYYIGQHNTPNMKKRKKGHLDSYDRFLKEKASLVRKYKDDNLTDNDPKLVPKGYCTALFRAFSKYGPKNFTWEILKSDVPINELNEEEDKFIKRYNSMSPHGYNLKMNNGEKYQVTSAETRARMSYTHRNNLHKSRKNVKELEGMPAHVTYFDSNGLRGYRIVRHPNIPSKEFADFTTDVEELKKQTLAFLEEYKDKKFTTVQQLKATTGVPKGISKMKRQNAYLVQFAYQGTKYHKFFKIQKDEDDSIALNKATEWMNDQKKLLKSQIKVHGKGSTDIARLMELFRVIDNIRNQ